MSKSMKSAIAAADAAELKLKSLNPLSVRLAHEGDALLGAEWLARSIGEWDDRENLAGHLLGIDLGELNELAHADVPVAEEVASALRVLHADIARVEAERDALPQSMALAVILRPIFDRIEETLARMAEIPAGSKAAA